MKNFLLRLALALLAALATDAQIHAATVGGDTVQRDSDRDAHPRMRA
ncbi:MULTISPECIES: hypothetical protein [unclassified Variovorax]